MAETRLVFAFRAQRERLAAAQGRVAPIPLGARRQDPRLRGLPEQQAVHQLGNVDANDRAALILMDYPNRWRLKIYAHAELRDLAEFYHWKRKLQAHFFAGDLASAVYASLRAVP